MMPSWSELFGPAIKVNRFRVKHHAPGAYFPALIIGLSLVLFFFSRWTLTGGLPSEAPPRPDFAQHVIGQLYFSPSLGQLDCTTFLSIALFVLHPEQTAPSRIASRFWPSMAKSFSSLLPPFQQVITLYQALTWIMQSVAAVFALRSAGERRWLSTLAVSLKASSILTFLFRF